MLTKKRKSTKLVEKHVVQSNLCSNLKAVYFSKDEASIKRGVQRIFDLFNDVSKSSVKTQFFLDEIRFRMDFLMDNKTGQTARVRCLRTLALCAIQLMKNGELKLLDYIVDYCKNLYEAESQVLRQYVCILIGIFYNAANLSNDEYGTASILPDGHYRTLFSILKERWIDTSDAVRREAICALSFIQQDAVNADHDDAVERSPRDMLMTSLGDCAAECREEAVKRLIITDVTQAKLILNVAQRDTDVHVKEAALRVVLLADEKFEEISPRAKLDVLEHLLAPSQQNLSHVVEDLLIHWVEMAARAQKLIGNNEIQSEENEKFEKDTILIGTLHFLRNLDVVKKEKVCEKALAIVLRNLAKRYKGLVNLVSTLTERSDECLQRNNYRMLLLEPGSTLAENALLLFHWRVLVELCCVEYEKRDDQKSICLFNLVPTLHAFAEFVTNFIESYGESQESPFLCNLRGGRRKLEESRQFCLIQLLRILQCLDREPVGMNSWKKLLFSILSNTEVRLGKSLVKIVVESIMHFHYSDQNDAETALHEFCDVINSFMHAEQNAFNATTSSIGRFSPSRGFIVEDTPAASTVVKSQMDDPTRERSLLIMNAMLRSGFFKTITAELQGLYDSILPDSFGSFMADIRILALECLGVFSLLDEEYAKQHICLVAQALLVDLKNVKLICIDILTDLILYYGYANVTRWYRRFDDDNREQEEITQLDNFETSYATTKKTVMMSAINADISESAKQADLDKTYDIIEKMIELSTLKCPDISFRATECLCKWCIAVTGVDDVFAWRHVVQHLLLLSFRDECKENARQMGCLSRFIPLFVGSSRLNQTLLAEVFISAMNTLKDRDLESELTSVDENALASYVVKMTSFNVLGANAFEREKGSAHSYLAKMVLTGLKANVDDYFSSIYCKMLTELEMNMAIEEDELTQLIFICTDVFNEASDDTKNMRLLQQFLARLSALRDKIRSTTHATGTRRAGNVTPLHSGTSTSQALKASARNTSRRGANAKSPLKTGNVNLTTPQRRTRTTAMTPRTASAKKKIDVSIATLTSELSIGRKKSKRDINAPVTKAGAEGSIERENTRRAMPRINRRPVIERAAKRAADYRTEETIAEVDEDDYEDNIVERENDDIF